MRHRKLVARLAQDMLVCAWCVAAVAFVHNNLATASPIKRRDHHSEAVHFSGRLRF